MDKLKLRRGCALATTLCMLLTGCSLGAGSSEEKAASSVAAPSNAPAVEAPQTTASPVEQTGFGYEASGAVQVIDGGRRLISGESGQRQQRTAGDERHRAGGLWRGRRHLVLRGAGREHDPPAI